MDIVWYIGTEDNKRYFRCRACGGTWISVGKNPSLEHYCKTIENGPGTELESMLKRLNVKPCSSCLSLKYKMNEWGPDGCKRHIDIIVDDISTRTIVPKYLIKRTVLKAIKKYEKKVNDVSVCNHTT